MTDTVTAVVDLHYGAHYITPYNVNGYVALLADKTPVAGRRARSDGTYAVLGELICDMTEAKYEVYVSDAALSASSGRFYRG